MKKSDDKKNKARKISVDDAENSVPYEKAESSGNISKEGSGDEEPLENSDIIEEEMEVAREEAGDLNLLLSEMKENWQRERASFKNYRKRVEEEKKEIRQYAIYNLAFDLLRVLDYFESSISFAENSPEGMKNVIDGVKYTVEELRRVLSSHGVTSMDIEKGGSFDSRIMEAVGRVEREDVEPGVVLEVQRQGWYIHDRILRAGQVVVSAEPGVKDKDEDKKAESGGDEEQSG